MKEAFFTLGLLWSSAAVAAEPLLDFWDEEPRLVGYASAGQFVDHDLDKRRGSSYDTEAVTLAYSDSKVGDYSLVYDHAAAGAPNHFGLVAGLWGEHWSLTDDMTLRFWAKVSNSDASEWVISLVDDSGKQAKLKTRRVGDKWSEVSAPLSKFAAAAGFNWSRVRLMEFNAPFGARAEVNLDGVRFEGKGAVIGVTDKSRTQRMQEAKANREARSRHAFLAASAFNKGSKDWGASGSNAQMQSANAAFAKLMVNEDVETANAIIVHHLRNSSELSVWSLWETPYYIRLYYTFSSRAGKYPGRLKPETEALLLETLWDRTVVKNDISWTRDSTWDMVGSENHDLQAKACNFISSRIFMNEPGYRDRVYPNHGYGQGNYYGHGGYYGPGVKHLDRHGGGRAKNSDGKAYRAADHYAAWRDFFKEYVQERSKRGFFLENGSPGYFKMTMSFIDLAHHYSGDEELERYIDNFVSLVWAEWAQTSISGRRGGPRTRYRYALSGDSERGTGDLASFMVGGPGNGQMFWQWGLLNDYELPPIVWGMMLDRKALGAFTYTARGIGEEKPIMPRPLGAERSTLLDVDSRFVKQTYVTPDYTLGTQMDHPLAIHSHLSIADRWHGMTVSRAEDAMVVPVALPKEKSINNQAPKEYELNLMLQTVQNENVLVAQQYRRWTALHPEWFPADHRVYDRDVGVWVGKDWEERIERDGWVFLRSGDVFSAVRPVTWDEPYERSLKSTGTGNQVFFNKPFDEPTVRVCAKCYTWNAAGSIMQLQDNYSAIIIEASSQARHASFQAFMSDVLDNPIALYKTVVPGFHVLTYTGTGKDAKEIVFNLGAPEIPTVGGKYLNYEHPWTFDSPYLRSPYKSGVVTLRYRDEERVFDFN
jgi:hypothetical protein